MPHGFRGWANFAVAQTILTFIWHWTLKLPEHAILTWSDDQIAILLGFSAPHASTVVSWAIPALLGAATLFLYHLIQARVSKTAIATSVAERSPLVNGTVPGTPKSVAAVPLGIEMGTGDNYERIEHLDNGLFRRAIYVAVQNNCDIDKHKINGIYAKIKNGQYRILIPGIFCQ
jgi:hypothetical protein